MNTSKSIIDLAMELGEKLAERKRLIEESLPPQLREGFQEVFFLCEGELAPLGFDPDRKTFPCNNRGEYRYDLDVYLCADCYRGAC